MSVETGQYFRPNSYNTLLAMCGDDESCAQKYEFTFDNKLADYMNPVERVSIPAAELTEGYYVIGVHAHTLTESPTQTYGIAAAGGDLVLLDMASVWGDLGLEVGSTGGGGGGGPSSESDPVAGSGSDSLVSPAPAVATPESMTAAPSSVKDEIILAPPGTPSPTEAVPDDGGESATNISGSGDGGSGGGENDDGGGSSSSGTAAGDRAKEGAGYDVVGGGGDDSDDGVSPSTDLTADGNGGGGGGWNAGSKIAVGVSAFGAVVLIGVGMCVAMRRRKVSRKDETGSFLLCARSGSSSRVVRDVDDEDVGSRGMDGQEGSNEGGEGEDDDIYQDMPPLQARLPGYATAVASMPEEEGTTIIRGHGGVEEVIELGAGDESEVSGFYAAVDPEAVSKLVGWGIGRDFARVALRQMDNDIPEALKMIARGDMDAHLAMDHEEMAREGAAAADLAAAAATEAVEALPPPSTGWPQMA